MKPTKMPMKKTGAMPPKAMTKPMLKGGKKGC